MTKTEKKQQQLLIKALTDACEQLKLALPNFTYLTHHGSANNKKHALKVELFCVSKLTKIELEQALTLLNQSLHKVDIKIKAQDILLNINPV